MASKGMVWSKLPVFTGKTSWDLLAGVRKAILEEPKRVNMGTWIDDELDEAERPVCGTQGCIGGWMVLMTMPKDHGLKNAYGGWGFDIMDRALEQLPAEARDNARHLFLGRNKYPFPKRYKGQRRYALKVAENITKFMKAHEDELKAFPVKGRKGRAQATVRRAVGVVGARKRAGARRPARAGRKGVRRASR